MVSFTCNHCQDVVKKPKVQSHANSCGRGTFTCVDCMHVFDLDTIKAHTSCVTEEEKYQGKWKQKIQHGNGGSGSASSFVAPRVGIERPPRAPMNDLSSDDDDSDGDWATRGRNTTAGAAAAAAAKKSPSSGPASSKPSAPAPSRKHPRPGVRQSSSDDEDDETHMARSGKAGVAAPSAAPAQKKARTSSPATRPAATSPLTTAKKAAPHTPVTAKRPEHAGNDSDMAHPGKKDTPLLLPRSTTSTECVVPSFVLGTSAEVADIVADVLSVRGVASMRAKDLSKELVERYAKRIAKSVRHAVETAAEMGALHIDKNDSVSLA